MLTDSHYRHSKVAPLHSLGAHAEARRLAGKFMKLRQICGVELRPRVVYEVEVDSCPKCGGEWLDGGELQKLIAKIREYRDEYYSDKRYREWEEVWREKKNEEKYFRSLTRCLTEAPRSFTAEYAVDAAPRGGPAGRSRL